MRRDGRESPCQHAPRLGIAAAELGVSQSRDVRGEMLRAARGVARAARIHAVLHMSPSSQQSRSEYGSNSEVRHHH